MVDIGKIIGRKLLRHLELLICQSLIWVLIPGWKYSVSFTYCLRMSKIFNTLIPRLAIRIYERKKWLQCGPFLIYKCRENKFIKVSFERWYLNDDTSVSSVSFTYAVLRGIGLVLLTVYESQLVKVAVLKGCWIFMIADVTVNDAGVILTRWTLQATFILKRRILACKRELFNESESTDE